MGYMPKSWSKAGPGTHHARNVAARIALRSELFAGSFLRRYAGPLTLREKQNNHRGKYGSAQDCTQSPEQQSGVECAPSTSHTRP